jgi:hypothetical protein
MQEITSRSVHGWSFLSTALHADAEWPFVSYKLKLHLNRVRLSAVSVRQDEQFCPGGIVEHKRVEAFLYRFWMCNRLSLYDSDEPGKDPKMHKSALSTTSAMIPWLALAHLVALRTDDGRADLAIEEWEAEWLAWRAKPPALDCLRNQKGYLVCDKAPYQQSLNDVKHVFSFLSRRIRSYTYIHLHSVHEYLRMLLERCLLLSVCTLEGDFVTAATEQFQEAQHWQYVCKFEMLLFAMLYPCFVATKFKARSSAELSDGSVCAYEQTLEDVTVWLQSNTEHGKFNDVGALFRMDYESSLVMPGKREEFARMRGVAYSNITTQFLIQEKRPSDFQKMQDLFQQPLIGILEKKRGSWQARQLLYMRLMNLYLSGVGWPWEDVRVVREHELLDGNVVKKLLYSVGRVVVAQLFNGFVVVTKHDQESPAYYYACDDILQVFARFVMLTQNSALGTFYDAFYYRFRDSGGGSNTDGNVTAPMQIEDMSDVTVEDSSSSDEDVFRFR